MLVETHEIQTIREFVRAYEAAHGSTQTTAVNGKGNVPIQLVAIMAYYEHKQVRNVMNQVI